MKSASLSNYDGNHHHITVLERQRSRIKFQEEQQAMEGDDGVLGGYALLDNRWNEEFGYPPVQRTASCAPGAAARGGNSADGCGGRETQRKRKADHQKEKKMKGCEEDESRVTDPTSNCKSTTTSAAGSAAAGKKSNGKASDGTKLDYIHVRARRGQATDSHSLAERVRREKISERMKYLQDLVPGCNKITGKAGMLDEIINYVQSLQKQVEFLSMKLSTLNPQLEFDMDNYLSKGIYSPCTSTFPAIGASSGMDPLPDHGIPGLVLGTNTNATGTAICRIMSTPPVTVPDNFFDSSTLNQIEQLNWEDELQNLVAMDWQQGRASIFAGNVKMEM